MQPSYEVFLKVVEEKNFSNAAKRLHMSQPAVSQHVRSLESELGVTLLERTNKYVRVNKAGQIVYQYVKEMAMLEERMRHLVTDLTEVAAGNLTVGASYTFGEYVLPALLAKLNTLYPAIEVDVTIGNSATIADCVSRHVLDIGIVEGATQEGLVLHTEVFAEDQMVVVVAADHPLLALGRPVKFTELQDFLWVLREEGSGTREAAERIFSRYSFSPTSAIQFSSTQPIKAMVAAGDGVTILSEWAIQKELQYGDLKILEIDGMPESRQFSLLMHSHFQTKAATVFLELLRNSNTSSR